MGQIVVAIRGAVFALSSTGFGEVEFEILFSCYEPFLENRLNEIKLFSFTDSEILILKNNLLEFTNDVIDNFKNTSKKASTSIDLMKKGEADGLVSGPEVLNFMENKKPSRMKFGQAIIFNPFVIHGNIPFNSELARIACNVRFQSFKKPLLQKNTEYLKYYKLP